MMTQAQETLKRMRIPQRHVSEILQIKQPRLCRILQNKDLPTEEELEKLKHYFNMSEQELFTTTGV